MSDNEKKETIADKAKEGLATAATAAKEQLDALKTKEGRDALKDKAKEKASSYMNAIREKAPGYWQTIRDRTVKLWNCGPKGKAACIGMGASVLLLGCLVFGGKSNNDKSSKTPNQLQAESSRSTTDGKAKSGTMSKEEMKQREKIAMAQAVQAAMERAGLEDEEVTDSDERAESILTSNSFLWRSKNPYYKPEKKVSYKEFAKIYYMIEDAFLPEFVSSLPALRSEKGCSPSLALKLSRDLVSRADHLVYYCCRTGLVPDATGKEKSNYVKLLKLAMMGKKMIASYAVANDASSRSLVDQELEFFLKLRNTLPKHEPAADAEQRYAALPYPSYAINVESEPSSSVEQNAKDFEHNLYVSWPAETRDKDTPRQKELVKTRAELAQKKWHSLAIGNFPIKTFCGLEFGQTIAACEKVLGDALGPVYKNNPNGFAAYLLKKPFRKFTRACLRFETDQPGYEGSKKKEPYFQGLRSIQLEADISEDINYDSCLEELAKVKKLLEEKYKLNLGKVVASEGYSGKSFWYGAGLDTGWIVLGIRPATDGMTGRAKGGNKTLVLEVRCADARSMKDWANVARKELDDKLKSEMEAKKEKLNLSADAGADVL